MISGTLNRESSDNKQLSQPDNSGPKGLYLKIPYILDRIDYRITELFKKRNIPVRIPHENITSRQILHVATQPAVGEQNV